MNAQVAEVSAPGRGAVATVRVWGPDALALVSEAFRPAKPGGKRLADTPANRLRVGRIGQGLGDEVVAVVLNLASPEVEIQCHGGPVAVDLVVAAMVTGEATRSSARAWARQAADSSIRVDARDALARASTVRVAEVLVDQAEGALEADLDRAVVAIEIEDVGLAGSILDRLINLGAFGVRLLGGWRVVLAGRPNVGKSRLLNALAGFDRAIVASTPGTTRDVVTNATAMAGWPVEVADTAGLRTPADPIEAQGVAMARAHQAEADLVVVVLDRSEPITDADRAILDDHPDALVVANKSDLTAAWDRIGDLVPSTLSAERGDGVEDLIGAIVDRLDLPVTPPGSGVPFRPVHVRRLRAIRDQLREGNPTRARRSLLRWLGRGGGSNRGVVPR